MKTGSIYGERGREDAERKRKRDKTIEAEGNEKRERMWGRTLVQLVFVCKKKKKLNKTCRL